MTDAAPLEAFTRSAGRVEHRLRGAAARSEGERGAEGVGRIVGDGHGPDGSLGYPDPDEPRVEQEVALVEPDGFSEPDARAEQQPHDGADPCVARGVVD